MTKKTILAGLCVLLLGSLFLAACQGASPQVTEPTLDPNAILTQAAQTVAAGITQTAAAQPTATQTPTITPTSTMDPAMAQALTATANAVLQAPTQATTPLASPTVNAAGTPLTIPTATRAVVNTPPAAVSPDKCVWVANNPADSSKLKRNASYDATIVVKNTGTTTWDKTYALRFFGGEKMGIPNDYYIQGEVKPNEEYKFIFTIVMPDSLGKKEALLVVQNGQGQNMCFINLPYEVVDN